MKPIINRWQFWCRPAERMYYRGSEIGWRVFELGCIKLIKMPLPYSAIGSEEYKGFIIRFAYWFPIDRA